MLGQRWDWILNSELEATEENYDETNKKMTTKNMLHFHPAKEYTTKVT
jgi:hypothetical protein